MHPTVRTLRDYSRAHVDILKQLRAAGISQDVELPCIVVVGVQSVGKSSLIEAMSTLKLPRGVGTCTKCPMEFRTEYSDPPLLVDITLCYGSEAGEATDVPFRNNLTDLNEIRRAIADAQDHVLKRSPLGAALAFPGAALPTFTKDCVRISAKGPDMHDLYFYDIPGVIHEVKDEQDPKQIDLIKDLVKKYVSKRNCIVLLVMSCEVDFEIGGVARLIFADSDPELKARTVGVLTKADRIERDSWPTRLETFNNQHLRLDNGWFAVSLCGGDISWEAARVQENEFFSKSEFWSLVPEEDKNRLGSQNLTQFISRLLSNRVADSLPAISAKLRDDIDRLDKKLRLLPIHTEHDAQMALIAMIVKFSSDFSAHIQGIPPKFLTKDVGLVYKVNRLYESIRNEISQRTPRFSPANASDSGASEPSSPAWARISAAGEILYLDQIAEYIELSETRELPTELPYGITQRIITELVKNWETAAITGFRSVKAIADEHFNALVRTHFAEYKRGGLFSTMKRILEENMFDCAANTEAEITEMAARELAPYTVLRAEFIALQTALEQDYRHQLGTHGSTATMDLLEAFLLANKDSIAADLTTGVFSTVTKTLFSTFGRHPSGQNATDQNSIVVEQNCDFALKVMSRTQAYLELASKRFAEVTVKCIDHAFLRKLDSLVHNAVRALPISASPQMCLEVLQDPSTFQQRRSIAEKRKHYAHIKNIVDDARRELEMDTGGFSVSIESLEIAPGNSESVASLSPSPLGSSTADLSADLH